MRKLVSIVKIDDILPIENADAIEAAVIGGWTVVVKKNEFHSGDRVLYFEVDSILPKGVPQFEFLMNRSCGVYSTDEGDNLEGHRLKTIKLRGKISQGLVIPIPVDWKTLPNTSTYIFKDENDESYLINEDGDFSRPFGVKKYEKRISATLGGDVKGYFPSFIPKTDQERVQNLKREFAEYVNSGMQFEATEKLDGTSCTMFFNDGEFGVCSRNLELKNTTETVYWEMARLYDVESKLVAYGRNIAIQGEIIGTGIQNNQYGLVNQRKFFVFDIYDIDNKRYFNSDERRDWCQEHDMLHVPVVSAEYKFDSPDVMDAIPIADGATNLNGTPREGIVFKSLSDPSVSFKIISNKWLLKYD